MAFCACHKPRPVSECSFERGEFPTPPIFLPDRRCKMFDEQEVYPYLIGHPEYYESLDRYRPRSETYIRTVKRHLPDDWEIQPSGIWLNARPPSVELPRQGFKIHVSAIPRYGVRTLNRVLPVIRNHNVPFKCLIDPYIHEFSHNKQYSRPQSGKFITIYPRNMEEFRNLLEALHRKTRDLDGPYILSDFRYPGSRVLFYRYGSFTRTLMELQVDGSFRPVIQAPDGRYVPDRRNPYPEHPEWIEDPFNQNLNLPDDVILHGRYYITEAIQNANSGGVYRAIDQKTGRQVIIKEARPHIGGYRRHPWDSVALLMHEYRVLQKLKDTGWTPKPIDCFRDWEHFFIVESEVPGVPLRQYRSSILVSPLLKPGCTTRDVEHFIEILKTIYEQARSAIESFHERGILIGDLSPANIMVDPDSLRIHFIDFEGAYDPEDPVFIPVVTPGYASRSRYHRFKPRPEDDWFALAMILYGMILPVQSFFTLYPSARARFLNEIIHDYGFPSFIKKWIYTHLHGHSRVSISADSLQEPCKPIQPPHSFKKTHRGALRRTLDGIAREILSSADTRRSDRLWPASPQVFYTNPMNVAYGACGTALFLHRMFGELPPEILNWMTEQKLTPDRYPPGLYTGLAGIAWTFDYLGFHEKAESILKMTESSTLMDDIPEILFGLAGWGLTCLYFYHRTRNPNYLSMAKQAREKILRLLKTDDHGLYWIDRDGTIYHGYGHGSSGIAWFFLNLYRYTRVTDDRQTAIDLLQYEMANALEVNGTLTWFYTNKNRTQAPYWRLGAAGIGSVFVRASIILNDPWWLEQAKKIAGYLSGKYAVAPGLFLGLSGIGEFFIDMYRATNDSFYLHRAFQIARSILLYRISRKQGYAFTGIYLMRICHDLAHGSAGTGLFFLRLLNPDMPRPYMDIVPLSESTEPLSPQHKTESLHQTEPVFSPGITPSKSLL